ncbi:MAG: hypothetical protein A2X19_02585 [Bacteroidetes bacterium GWE2_39_28]|nr:MAG: hypothetical protein A2X19_02585 [Bacteroidetes bacterium GWE2_39_28]OFY11876.1 MAG: hypothetical protein A2X16_06050 [Bacteroidetes bacterium GWF2_39_10]OFZ08640.1 MAG: hypothetical protein A2322_00870 [Bacteroidetes bacterium RIFOXYB2_FULL_39_7]OFZ11363.1 MAG: hypothetical protein A2465_09565 [Bacteroidetes bacterium RIFOXYC2_FULL_39_11]HCT95224.1 hypothetical protein [Rikenellaceae bacterium]
MECINNWLISKIINRTIHYFKKYGLVCKIEDYSINKHRVSLYFNEITIFQKDRPNEIVNIGSAKCTISLFRSLFNWAVVGEISLKNLTCQMNIISAIPLRFGTVAIAFRIGKKIKLVGIDYGKISCLLQLTSKKGYKELIIDLPFKWNDFRDLLSPNFSSEILKNLWSEDKLQLQVYLKKTNNIKNPYVYAKIFYDNLSFNDISKEISIDIDKDYLISLFDEKFKHRNIEYIVYEDISEDLINTIICTEDPMFWVHKGVATEFIGLAIAVNFKEQRIARGASTITMQLIRNLFLSHDRNIIRKTEEVALALLLENYYKIDKKTIIELYFNIIEFAPEVYGLSNACYFYFDKKHSDLTLEEVVTLSYIIPRPKHFYAALMINSQQLKINLLNHINHYTYVLLDKELISVNKYLGIKKKLYFKSHFGILKMNEFEQVYYEELIQKNLIILDGLHPKLCKIIKIAIVNSPVPFIITEGLRSTTSQKSLYAQGRSLPGTIVTNCDGVNTISNHQMKEDGYGYALDLYPLINRRIRIHESYVPELLYIIAVHIKKKATDLNIKINWGGEWNLKDYSHFEYVP